MAEALVGGAFLSASLQVLFDRMATPEFVDFFRQRKLNEGDLEKLKIVLLSVHKLREDAEDKQLMDRSVGEWLYKLKDVVYDAENVLDEIATEALQRKLDAEFQTTASYKVRKSISTFLGHFVKEIDPKIKEVLGKLEYLAKQKDVLGLKEGVGGESSKRSPTTSFVEESGIFGRDDEKEKIISLLLSKDATGDENPCVIPIVGMGGIGKTTLAQLVYKDKRVKEHFNLKAWVCVSEEFDVLKLTKTILEEVGSSTSVDSKNLNLLQVTLNDKLKGNKFLLVLDDVWNENYADWELLSNPFKSGAPGSIVIVTTRNEDVASIMHAVPTDRLKTLLEEDCWSLFAKHAFHNSNFDARSELEVIGRQIVRKCEGLPLAAKTIGGLLRSKPNVDEWENILKSELWDLPVDKTGILPALRLSYKYLPSHLKQCFAYCSIFPKDYILKKDEVVLLWMAEGFLEETRNKRMEKVGEDYFLALASRSLLEQSTVNKSGFVMHDLVNDLAKFVSGQFTFRLEVDHSPEIMNKTRHLSFSRTTCDDSKKFEALYEATRLHTFLPLKLSPGYGYFFLAKRVLLDLLPKLRCLRVLSLSHYRNMEELPKSIGKIKHLRYLNLSSTSIKRLPDSICKLCNLQTLNLSGCRDLGVLPRDMRKLINLRHLDISETAIKEMPMQLGRLKCLQTLTKFIISKHNGTCIEELGKLANLRGKLSIFELQNVVCPPDALKPCLKDKKYLEELVLEWNALDTNISECRRYVLDNLRPHSNLKSLTINNYGAGSLPEWVGHHSFSNITFLRLDNCKHCLNLPPLGQLSSLHNLTITGFEEVVKVDSEFYGSNSSSGKPFGALKVLRFVHMYKWEEWSCFGAENESEAFPQLEELEISNCPKLIGGLPVHLPSLAKLEIWGCPQLVASLPRAPALCELELSQCNEVLLKKFPTGLRRLKINGFDALESLPHGLVDSNDCLQELFISYCLKLELPTHPSFSSLETLLLQRCDSLKSLPFDLFPKLYRIRIINCKDLESFTVSEQDGRDLVTLDIRIVCCPNFVSFPKGGIRAPDLKKFWVDECESLLSLPEKMHILLPSLKLFHISDCPVVELLPEGGFPFNLETIRVYNCEKLFASRMGWDLQKLPSVRSLTIHDKSEDVESFPEPGLLPSGLNDLDIGEFPNMKSLDKKGLQHLTSLRMLWVWDCHKLEYIPEEGLPASLSSIHISNCPLLKKQWQSKKGKERRKIPAVDRIQIDGEYIERVPLLS